MSGEGDEVDDKDDGGVTQETEPTEITPLIHQHRTYGPDGRVVVDTVCDPGEYRQPRLVDVSHQSTLRTPDNTGTTGRRNCMADRANDLQYPHPRTVRLRNYGSLLGCVAKSRSMEAVPTPLVSNNQMGDEPV